MSRETVRGWTIAAASVALCWCTWRYWLIDANHGLRDYLGRERRWLHSAFVTLDVPWAAYDLPTVLTKKDGTVCLAKWENRWASERMHLHCTDGFIGVK